MALCFIFLSLNVLSQNKNSFFSKVDTTKIKIGEKIDFQLNIVLDKSKEVVFLDSTFNTPFEIIEDHKLDTIQEKNGVLLTKKYSITSFEPGNFYIKPKRIDIKNAKNIAKKIVSSFLAVSFGKLIEGLIPIGPRLFLV